MPDLIINGEAKQLQATSLTALLKAEAVPEEHWRALAIARNGSVVPKSGWADVVLCEGDRIEIVMPFAGG